MDFGRPDLLLLFGLLLPAAAVLFLFSERWQRAARARFLNPEAAPARRLRTRVKAGMALAGLALLVIAVARPHLGFTEPTAGRVGSDIVVALDVSLSMAANDIQPTRLDRAKAELSALLDRIEGDRVGLVVFAGAAAVRFPLTTDV